MDKLALGLDLNFVRIDLVIEKVVKSMHDNISTKELDELAAETCAYMNIIHPNYSILAARIAVSNLHKETCDNFAETISNLRNYID